MKKIILLVNVILLITLLFEDVSYADTSPKPSIVVHIENPKLEQFDIDLLVYHDKETRVENVKDEYIKNNRKIFEVLLNYNENGYVAESLRNSMLWKRDESFTHKTNTWEFDYFGVPNDFKVIIVYSDGTYDVTELIHRNAFKYEITVDANTMKVIENSKSDLLNVNIIPIFITIVIEYFIFACMVNNKWKNIVVIVLTNALTNYLMQIFLNIAGNLLAVIIGEFAVVVFEYFLYSKLIEREENTSIGLYVIIANATSAFFSLIYWIFISI